MVWTSRSGASTVATWRASRGSRTDGSTRRYGWRPYPDFGDPLRYTNRTVNGIIAEGFPVSAVLGLTAYLIALVVGLIVGILAAVRQHSWVDHATMAVLPLASRFRIS